MNPVRHLSAGILLTLLVTMLMISVAFAVYEYRREYREAVADVWETAGRLNEEFLYTLRDPTWNMVYDQVEVLVENKMRYRHLQAIVVRDDRGDLIAGRMRDAADRVVEFNAERFPDAAPGNTLFVSGDRLERLDFYLGEYRMYFGDHVITRERRQALRRIVLQFALLVLATSGLAYISLRTNVVAPVLRLGEAVQSFASDRSRRVTLNRRDELGRLARRFNEMADYIQTRDEKLEQTINDRTRQLAEAQTMASLGVMVAGVAHEINTPVGNGLTAATHGREISREFFARVEQGEATQDEFEVFRDDLTESNEIVLNNLERAAALVGAFKQVAVDRSSEEHREITVGEYLEDVLLSLRPELKRTNHTVRIQCPEDLTMLTYPGLISQVFTNLITNSLIHGFRDHDDGTISITVDTVETDRGELVRFVYEDDGSGIPPENANRIFDPFFTTNRSRGSSGLGMNVIYNIVTQKLRGTIALVDSPQAGGVRFEIEVPRYGQG